MAAITTFTVHYEQNGEAQVAYITAPTFTDAHAIGRVAIPTGATFVRVVREKR